jgi:hypothetical protein
VPIRFAPTSSGPKGATLAATTSEGQVDVGLSGNGVSPDPQLSLAPPAVSFGGTSIGSQGTGTVTIANAGGAPLTIGAIDGVAPPFSLAGVPAPGTELAPGESVVLDVDFDPHAVGRFADELTVHSDGGDETVGVSGTAGDPPTLDLVPWWIRFGATAVGSSRTATFVVRNSGGSPLTITKSKPPPGGEFVASPNALPEGKVIPAGGSITQTVRFRPRVPGDRSDSWTITGNDGRGVQVVRFDGRATAPSGHLSESLPVAKSPFPAAVLSRLRVRPRRVSWHRRAHATFRLSRAVRVKLVLRCPGRRHCRSLEWSIAGHAGRNDSVLPRRIRRIAGGYRLLANPAGGRAHKATFRVLRRPKR